MTVITLEYHDVVSGPDFDSSGFSGPAAGSYKLARQDFDAHLAALAPADGFGTSVLKLGTPPRGAVLLTFDDGGVSARTEVMDALAPWRATAHIFVTTGRIGSRGFCGAADLRALASAGHVLGSHSVSHPTRMSLLARAAMEGEWRDSVRALEDILGQAVTTASVPGGYFSRAVAESAGAAGIRWLFTSEPTHAMAAMGGCTVTGRYTLRRDSSAGHAAALVGRSPVARTRQWIWWNAKKAVKRVAGAPYLLLRDRILERQR